MAENYAAFDEMSRPNATERALESRSDYTMRYLGRFGLGSGLPGPGDVAPEFQPLGDFILTRAAPAMLARCMARGQKPVGFYWRLTLAERNPNEKKALAPPRLMRLHAPSFDFGREGGQQAVLVLLIPSQFFAGAGDLAATYPIEDVGLGALLGDFLLSLERRLPAIEASSTLAEALAALLSDCLAPIVPRQATATDKASQLLFERFCRHIQANLRAPDLGPAQLCQALGVSRSRFYRLFQSVGGVAAYIQLQRLQQARVELAEGPPRPVSQIAEEFGFKDASGFSRSFKKQFGFSPTEARRRAEPSLRRVKPWPSRPSESVDP